jgi:hypothetical protein
LGVAKSTVVGQYPQPTCQQKGGIGFQLEIHIQAVTEGMRQTADRHVRAGCWSPDAVCKLRNGCELKDAHVWICKEELMNHLGEKTTE